MKKETEYPRYNLHSHVSLSASAGSGKTYALTLRLLKMLMTDVRPEHILCTTFTNKATHEMSERLMKRLNTLIRYNEAGEDLKKEAEDALKVVMAKELIDEADLARGRVSALKIYSRLLKQFSRLNISTIDKFFNSVLRLFPFEAGVAPDFSIMNEAEEEEIFRQAMDLFILETLKNPVETKLLEDFLFSLSRSQNNPQELLKKYFDDFSKQRVSLRAFANRSGLEAITIKKVLQLKDKTETAGLRAVKYARIFGTLMKRFGAALSKSAHAAIEKCINAETPLDVLNLAPFQKTEYRKYHYFKKAPDSSELSHPFILVREALSQYIGSKSEFVTAALLLFFNRYTTYADHIKKQRGSLSFSDVERLCYELLVGYDDESIINRDNGIDFFYYRLDARIKHLLMDEFQDTNTVQWAVFRPIVMEITADIEGSFFYVGDPKQAIYRFRGGESKLFQHVKKELEGRIVNDSLPKNYRSAVTIVDFVNKVFKHVTETTSDYEFTTQESHNTETGIVELLALPCPSKNDAVVEKLLTAVSDRIISIRNNNVPYREIAVLMQNNNGCAQVAEHLYKLGIPAAMDKKDSLFSSPSVRTVMGLLKYLADTENEIYLVEFFSQVFPEMTGIDDEEELSSPRRRQLRQCRLRQGERFTKIRRLETIAPQWHRRIKELLARVDFITVKELAVSIIRNFNLGSRFKDKGNLVKFIELTDGISQRGIGNPQNSRRGRLGLQDFIEETERYGDAVPMASDAEPDAVQVLTVHKAKGLEFEAVILPQINEPVRFDKKNSNFMFRYNENFDLEGIHLTPSKQELVFSSDLSKVYNLEAENAHLDALNLLYVALTRAKTGLFMIAPVITRQKKNYAEGATTWLSIISKALGIDENMLDAAQNTVLYTSGEIMSLKKPLQEKHFLSAGPGVLKNTMKAEEIDLEFEHDLYDEPSDLKEEAELEQKRTPIEDKTADSETDSTISPANLLARKYGEAFHFAMEHFQLGMDVEHAYAASLANYGYLLDEHHRKRLKTDLKSVMTDPFLSDLFQKGRTLTELPILAADREKTAFRFSAKFVDAVVSLDDKDELIVIDYKTQFHTEVLENYRKQVSSYMQLLERLYTSKSVRGMLVFVNSGVRIEPVEQ